MDNSLKLFSESLKMLESENLPAALAIMLPYVESHPYVYHSEELKSISANLDTMVHYMENGADDEMRPKLYARMLETAKRAVRNIRTEYRMKSVDFYKDAARHVNPSFSISPGAVRMELEDYVSDIAMLQLESEEAASVRRKQIVSAHYSYLQSLFCHITLSAIWTDEEANLIEETLLSPTVDSNDVQLLVSAIMIAVMNNFDFNKFRTLVHVYEKTSDMRVRQKALVAWLFSMTESTDVLKQKAEIEAVCRNPQAIIDIVDTQKQVFLCMNAEKDDDYIRKDIFPTLMESKIDMNRLGINGSEEGSSLSDILDPEAEDRAVKMAEDSVKRLLEMQKSGADIYFGGFSKMKRFPFFYTLANWFFPFSFDHPGIAQAIQQDESRNMVKGLFSGMPFCDSDKYSFSLAIGSVLASLPKDVAEIAKNGMAGNGDASGLTSDPIYMRLMFLQDLYRFFKLYQWHNQIYNPFAEGNSMFVASSLLKDTELSSHFPSLAQFLVSRNEIKAVEKLMPAIETDTSVKALMLTGVYYLDKRGDAETARRCFAKVLEQEPDNEKALRALAKAAYRSGHTDVAFNIYRQLCSTDDTPKGVGLEFAVILAKSEQFDEAAKLLYKLDFKYPDTIDVKRVLAWALMGQRNLQQADREYSRILENSAVAGPMDSLNAAYCKWFEGDVRSASSLLAAYYKAHHCGSGQQKEQEALSYKEFSAMLLDEFRNDSSMLERYGISNVDKMLVIRIAYGKAVAASEQ